jgi:signal transduction histidine kinase
MKALAQTVREELTDARAPAEQVEDLGVIIDQIDRLREVTREILDFARPRSGAESDLAALVRSALYVLRPEARRQGTAIAGDEIDEVGSVPGSPAAWQGVVFNLILNALRHAPAGSEVGVRLRRRREAVIFETENAGTAIAEAIVRRLFEPFVSDGDGGTGLGLAIVARRVRELGGTIALVVNDPGRIVFRVVLPVTGVRP